MISGEELAAYAAGEADPAVVTRVEAALAHDGAVARRLAAIRAVDDELAAWSTPDLGDAGVTRLLAAVDAELEALASSTRDLAGEDAAAMDPESRSRPGGVQAEGARPVPDTLRRRLRGWWAEQGEGRSALVGGLASAVVAIVVVAGAAVAVTGGLTGGFSGDDSAAESAEIMAATEAADGGERPVDAESLATGGLDAAEGQAAGSGEGAGDLASTESAADAPSVRVVDDGRVVAAIADIDPAALRDRLAGLVPAEPTAGADVGLESASEVREFEAPSEDDAADTTNPLLADGQLRPGDVAAATRCLGAVDQDPLIVEVVTLAPGRDVLLVVRTDRVDVIDVQDCLTLAVRRG